MLVTHRSITKRKLKTFQNVNSFIKIFIILTIYNLTYPISKILKDQKSQAVQNQLFSHLLQKSL